jgi:hypothetical protein
MFSRVFALFSRRRFDDDLDRELESHLSMLIEDNVGRGMTAEQARRAALIRLGRPASLKEQHRHERGLPWVDAVLHDLRFTFRLVSWLVLKRGLFQVATGLALGLGGALALSQVLRTALVQTSPTDPVTYVAITLILTAVSVAACLVPARRATRVDPLVALRAE